MNQMDMVKISRALGDQTRLRIYEAISGCDELFCGQIVEKYGLTPGTISHHLKILCDAHLIESRREGQFIYSRAVPKTLRDYGRWLSGLGGKSRIAGNRNAKSRIAKKKKRPRKNLAAK